MIGTRRSNDQFMLIYIKHPLKLLSIVQKSIDWREKFTLFGKFWFGILSFSESAEAELDLWEICWLKDTSCHPDKLKNIDFNNFMNVKIMKY